MRRTLTALVLGIALGIALTVVTVEVAGGWYTYRILGKDVCAAPVSLGTSSIAPGQPNPCLVRTPRFTH